MKRVNVCMLLDDDGGGDSGINYMHRGRMQIKIN